MLQHVGDLIANDPSRADAVNPRLCRKLPQQKSAMIDELRVLHFADDMSDPASLPSCANDIDETELSTKYRDGTSSTVENRQNDWKRCKEICLLIARR